MEHIWPALLEYTHGYIGWQSPFFQILKFTSNPDKIRLLFFKQNNYFKQTQIKSNAILPSKPIGLLIFEHIITKRNATFHLKIVLKQQLYYICQTCWNDLITRKRKMRNTHFTKSCVLCIRICFIILIGLLKCCIHEYTHKHPEEHSECKWPDTNFIWLMWYSSAAFFFCIRQTFFEYPDMARREECLRSGAFEDIQSNRPQYDLRRPRRTGHTKHIKINTQQEKWEGRRANAIKRVFHVFMQTMHANTQSDMYFCYGFLYIHFTQTVI